jgi:integrase
MTLDQARRAALELLAVSRIHGRDPIAEKRDARASAAARREQTFGSLAALYVKQASQRLSASRMQLEQLYLRKHLLPRFANKSVADLKSKDIVTEISEIAEIAGPAAANSCLEVIRQCLGHGVNLGWLEANPAAGVRPFPKISRERVARPDELAAVWKFLESGMRDRLFDSRATILAIQLSILTLQRRSEIAGLHAREIDWSQKVWTIPGPRTKNKKGPHAVPLSDAAIEVLKNALAAKPDGYAFTGRNSEALTPAVMTRAFARLTDRLGIEDLTLHDMRRTGATMLTSERLGVLGEVVSRILNHTPPGPAVTLVYNRNAYLPQKRAALEAWAEEVANLAST